MIPALPPLHLNRFAATELRGGLPLGGHSVPHPERELLARRVRWIQIVGNHTGLMGSLHRLLASGPDGAWTEPSVALAGALSWLQWSVQRLSLIHI